MTEAFASSYIPKRMSELGFTSYHYRLRELVIEKESSLTIPSFGEIWLLISEPDGVIITSSLGTYDKDSEVINEQTHEHQGEIICQNLNRFRVKIKWIQIIIES